MAVETFDSAGAPRVSLLNDPKVRGYVYQAIVILALFGFFAFITYNAIDNLIAQKKTTGYGFLFLTSGFDISFTLFPYSRSSLYWQAYVVGITNTLLVSVVGIIFATLLGFAAGIARLSSNWLISRIATVYIETLRNIPLLLQLFFWYFAVLKAMPGVRQSFVWFDSIVLNQRGLYVPRPLTDERFVWFALSILIAIVAALVVRAWARRRLEATGQRYPVGWTVLGIIVLLPLVGWFLSGTHVDFEVPVLKGFNYQGGVDLPPELVAMTFGLVVYTATFIAEIVRAGILAVSHGQTEAAASLGLREGDRLRLVVLPQALRVIIPPLTSQYLNLTKNSSLGAFIGFPELVNVFAGTTLNQTGRAIEVISLTMLVYLTFSLSTSVFMNWYNARVALKER
jgi:general L-amino acid transport system permease protein